MHKVEINVIRLEIVQRRCNAFLDTLVPWVVEFGGEPDLASRNTRVDDSLADFRFVAVCESSNASVSIVFTCSPD